jgi:hypothetical protein
VIFAAILKPTATGAGRRNANFQEVHSYYQTLKIDTYLAEIIEEGEALSVGINKK